MRSHGCVIITGEHKKAGDIYAAFRSLQISVLLSSPILIPGYQFLKYFGRYLGDFLKKKLLLGYGKPLITPPTI